MPSRVEYRALLDYYKWTMSLWKPQKAAVTQGAFHARHILRARFIHSLDPSSIDPKEHKWTTENHPRCCTSMMRSSQINTWLQVILTERNLHLVDEWSYPLDRSNIIYLFFMKTVFFFRCFLMINKFGPSNYPNEQCLKRYKILRKNLHLLLNHSY